MKTHSTRYLATMCPYRLTSRYHGKISITDDGWIHQDNWSEEDERVPIEDYGYWILRDAPFDDADIDGMFAELFEERDGE